MASSYVNNLRLEEIADGEQSGTWGQTTNTNLELIADAFGYGTEAIASDANSTITMADGAADGVRAMYLKITSGVSLTATRTVTLAPSTVSKIWFIENATSGSQTIEIVSSGTNPSIPNGETKVIYTDGSGAAVDAFSSLTLSSGTIENGVTVEKSPTITLAGDVTSSASAMTNLGNVSITTDIANSGVSAGSYTNASITVAADGRVTSASSGTSGATAGFAIAMAIAL